jgi:hypothetical protein
MVVAVAVAELVLAELAELAAEVTVHKALME